MIRVLAALVLAALTFVGGWVFGAFVPAPAFMTERVRSEAEGLLSLANATPDQIANLRARLSPEDFQRAADNAATLAASSGKALIVERAVVTEADKTFDEASAPPAAAPASTPVATTGGFETARICGGMTVSNRPKADAAGLILDGATTVTVQSVTLAINPTRGGACFASGFGKRGERMHKGVDYYSASGGDILAAAPGTVVEKKYRDDYGNMLVIDHGAGVFTRYAHLSSFDPAIEIGGKVAAGQQLGLMGNTAGYRIPVHLHYELLLGEYKLPAGSFGLTPRSPFDFAKAG